jgi:esterase/lipase
VKEAFVSRVFGRENKKVVIVLSGWTNTLSMFYPVGKILEWAGFYVVVYAYNPNILDPDIYATKQRIQSVVDDIGERIQALKKEDHTMFSVFGTSIGTLIALRVANKSKIVRKVILNISGANISDSVWGWGRREFPYFHEYFHTNHITLSQIRSVWKSIQPLHNINHLDGKKILIYMSKRDDIVPYSQQKLLVKEMKKRNISLLVYTNNCLPHVPTIIYNLMLFCRYINFLQQ